MTWLTRARHWAASPRIRPSSARSPRAGETRSRTSQRPHRERSRRRGRGRLPARAGPASPANAVPASMTLFASAIARCRPRRLGQDPRSAAKYSAMERPRGGRSASSGGKLRRSRTCRRGMDASSGARATSQTNMVFDAPRRSRSSPWMPEHAARRISTARTSAHLCQRAHHSQDEPGQHQVGDARAEDRDDLRRDERAQAGPSAWRPPLRVPSDGSTLRFLGSEGRAPGLGRRGRRRRDRILDGARRHSPSRLRGCDRRPDRKETGLCRGAIIDCFESRGTLRHANGPLIGSFMKISLQEAPGALLERPPTRTPTRSPSRSRRAAGSRRRGGFRERMREPRPGNSRRPDPDVSRLGGSVPTTFPSRLQPSSWACSRTASPSLGLTDDPDAESRRPDDADQDRHRAPLEPLVASVPLDAPPIWSDR